MKNFMEKVKRYSEILNYVAISFLLLLSCFFEPCVFLVVIYCILIAIFYNFEKTICLIIFTFPFQLIFQTSHTGSLYLFLILGLTIVVGIKYIIELFKQKKRLNFKTLIPICLFLIYLIIPVHIIQFSSYMHYVLIFALAYLIFEYRKQIYFKRIVLMFTIGLVISSVFFLCKFCSVRLKNLLPLVYAYDFVRYTGLFVGSNMLGLILISVLSCIVLLKYKNKLTNLEFFVLFTINLLFGYLTISRAFVIGLFVLIVLSTILLLVKTKKEAIKPLLYMMTSLLCVVICCFYPTKIYLARFNIIPAPAIDMNKVTEYEQIEFINKDGEKVEYLSDEWWDLVKSGEIYFDAGRNVITEWYISSWKETPKSIFFGKGVSAKLIGQLSAHSVFIQALWDHGLIGCLLLIFIICGFINFKNIKKHIFEVILLLASLLAGLMTESPSTISLLFLFILIVAICNDSEETELSN